MFRRSYWKLDLLTFSLLILPYWLSLATYPLNDSLMLSNTSDISTTLQPNDQYTVNIDSDEQKHSNEESLTDVFIPTDEWQTIQANQSIPAGCDVRISFQTGKKEAKWSADRNTDKFRVNTQNNNDSLPKISVYDPFKQPELASVLETENYNSSLEILQFLSTSENNTEILHKLDQLDMLLSDLDLAQLISTSEEFQVLISLLNTVDNNISSATCLLIGSMWQNNQQIQLIALEYGVLPILIQQFERYKEVGLNVNSLLFATSTLLRGLPYGLGIHYFTQYKLAYLFTDILQDNFNVDKIVFKVVRITGYLLEEFEDGEDALFDLRRREMLESIRSSDYCKTLFTVSSIQDEDIINYVDIICIEY